MSQKKIPIIHAKCYSTLKHLESYLMDLAIEYKNLSLYNEEDIIMHEIQTIVITEQTISSLKKKK